ncbi:MAG: hypothetical protein V4511_13680, partial [Bacteroidota bacterium]
MQTLILVLLTSIASAQIGPLPSYSKVSSVNYPYSEISTVTPKTLYVRSFPFLSICPSGIVGVQQIKKATVNGILNLGSDYRFGKSDFSYVIDITINGYTTWTGSSLPAVFTQTKQLTINCSSSSASCNPEHQFSIDFTSQHGQINRFVVSAAVVSTSGLTTTQSYLDLRVFYKEDFLYSYTGITAPTLSLTAIPSPANANPLLFDWTPQCYNAPNYEFQLLRLYNINSTFITDETTIDAYVDWNKALSIETGSSLSELKLTIPEGTGYYVWRVRPIGNAYEGGIANDRNWGPWNEDPIFIQGDIVPLTNAISYDNLFFYNQFDDDKNWIYSR